MDPQLLRSLEQRLISLQRSGVTHLPRRPAPREPVASGPPAPAAPEAHTGPAPGAARQQPPNETAAYAPAYCASPQQAGDLDSRRAALEALDREVRVCTRCAHLAATRTQTVFGVGHPEPPVVFFGEAPGAEEDRRGEPFVGKAGELLTRMLRACGWSRGDVYIMNVLKCRPPNNRTPTPEETRNCRPFFERQLEILQPPFIVCLGAAATVALLETTAPIGRLRGRFHSWRDSQVLVTYHPAYLLRNPSAKALVWDDLKKLLAAMGRPVPGPPSNGPAGSSG